LPEEVGAIPAEIGVGDSLGRAFVERLDEKGKLQTFRRVLEVFDLLDDGELRGGDTAKGQRLLGPRLVETEREGERVAP